MGIVKIIFKGIILAIFSILSAYVLMFGKKKTGLLTDYVITTIIFCILLLRLE